MTRTDVFELMKLDDQQNVCCNHTMPAIFPWWGRLAGWVRVGAISLGVGERAIVRIASNVRHLRCLDSFYSVLHVALKVDRAATQITQYGSKNGNPAKRM